MTYKNWQFLMDPFSNMRIVREDAQSLTASTEDGGPLLSALALELFRNSPLGPGDRFHHNGMEMHIVVAKNGSPTKIRFRVPDLDDAKKTCLMFVKENRLVRAKAPKIGNHFVVPNPFCRQLIAKVAADTGPSTEPPYNPKEKPLDDKGCWFCSLLC